MAPKALITSLLINFIFVETSFSSVAAFGDWYLAIMPSSYTKSSSSIPAAAELYKLHEELDDDSSLSRVYYLGDCKEELEDNKTKEK